MCRKRLGPQGEVGDSVEIQRFFVAPTPARGWDHVGTTGGLGQFKHIHESSVVAEELENDSEGRETDLPPAARWSDRNLSSRHSDCSELRQTSALPQVGVGPKSNRLQSQIGLKQ